MMPVNVPLNRPYDKLVFKDPGRKRIDQTAKHGDPAPKNTGDSQKDSLGDLVELVVLT